MRLHGDAAARCGRVHVIRQHRPIAQDRPAAVALVGSKPQHIDEVREGAQREAARQDERSEEHTSELQSLMRISYAVFCLKKKTKKNYNQNTNKYLLPQQ